MCWYAGDYPIWLQLVAGFVVLGTMVFFLVVFVIYPGFFDIVGGKDDRPERDRVRCYTCSGITQHKSCPLPEQCII